MIKELIIGFPHQLEKAIEIGKKIKKITPTHEIRNVVIAGLGGSGIGANIVENWLQSRIKVPITISKTYTVPNFVNENTLLITCSFSGGTEETLSALAQAQNQKSQIFAITAGGKLLEKAKEDNFGFVQIPNEAPCPRAFLGYSLVQLLYTFLAHDLIDNFFEIELENSIKKIKLYLPDMQDFAKKLAKSAFQHHLLAYGDGQWAAVLVRMQQQINENAKQLAHINIMPEMNHNELVGWGLTKETYQKHSVWLIRSHLDMARVAKRLDICKPIFEAKAGKVIEIKPKGDTLIEQSFYLIYLFDWVSWYLSELNEVDAFEIDVINHLKNELAKF
ncbi:MAG: bifunctional phosphoglucose/phosphomannose isomerase [Bacteroidetes bacterium]|nr:MAG: bifunctional phosphoglucose/phosphomannose isomerase [Bacteroidota bacterium]TAG88212.1 MAG: bifunctional phosphoglucose/phosphomannose isomerase [Bacteroidota bacterium]